MSEETDILSFLREEGSVDVVRPREMVPCVACGCAFELVDSVVQWRCPPCQALLRMGEADQDAESQEAL